jgi:uncharacterized protein with HEPN domain
MKDRVAESVKNLSVKLFASSSVLKHYAEAQAKESTRKYDKLKSELDAVNKDIEHFESEKKGFADKPAFNKLTKALEGSLVILGEKKSKIEEKMRNQENKIQFSEDIRQEVNYQTFKNDLKNKTMEKEIENIKNWKREKRDS